MTFLSSEQHCGVLSYGSAVLLLASTILFGLFGLSANAGTETGTGQVKPQKKPIPTHAAPEKIEVMSLGYSIKPSEVAVPVGIPAGQYRRIIQPFNSWTLICDENLKAQTRVCNITQSIMNTDGVTVFSWSLAATQSGQPFMILRIPATVGVERHIRLDFGTGQKPILLKLAGCDQTVCIAYLPVGPRMRGYIGKGMAAEISYDMRDQTGQMRKSVFFAPLAGLAAALAVI